jgi:Fic family protein
MQAIVDQYNMMINEISNDKSQGDKMENSFKCASVLVFGFLTLHPFADGNGRLARLLCDHCLNVFSPFPTAIYNMFSLSTRDDYITAIINARKDLKLSSDQIEFPTDAIREALLILEQKPADLCSLIIESNWFTWRRFLRKIGEDIPMLDFEKGIKNFTVKET